MTLQHPEELALQSQRQGVDLVEEQRAAVGRLNKTGLAGIQGSGESALGIAEQLRLQQVLRQGGAVDLDDGGIGSAAVAVDVLGQHLLAGAGLAGDEDGGVRLGHLSGSLEDGLHGGAVCDDGLLGPCAFRGEGRHLDGAVVLIEDSLLIPLGQQIQPDGLYQHILHLAAAAEDRGGRGQLAVVIPLGGEDVVHHGDLFLLGKGCDGHAHRHLSLRNQLESVEAQRLLPCGAHHLQKGIVAVDVISLAVEDVDPLIDVVENFGHEQWIGHRDPSVSVRKVS